MLDLEGLPANVRAGIERDLVKADREMATAETQASHVPPPAIAPDGRRLVFFPTGRRSDQIAVSKVLSVIAGAVETLNEDARAYLWSATVLRTYVERAITGISQHVFDSFGVSKPSFGSFRLDVLRAARTRTFWATYQTTLEERSGALATLSAQLRALLAETKWTHDDLAAETGLDRKTIYNHLNGKTQPTRTNLQTYERVFSKRLRRAVTLTA